MKEFYKRKTLDINQIKWGVAPAPLLPTSLRKAWASIELPTWVCKEVGLNNGSLIKDLGPEVWQFMDNMSDRLRHFLLFMVRKKLRIAYEYKCIDSKFPAGLKLADIGWDERTRNRLLENGLLTNPTEILNLTYGELSKLEGVGPMVTLDLCATLEGAIDHFNELVIGFTENEQSNTGENFMSVLENVLQEPWSKQISEQDPRFVICLPLFERGTLYERIEKLLTDPDAIDRLTEVPGIIDSINEVKKLIASISDAPLEESLLELLGILSNSKGERLKAIGARFGWTGSEAVTLEESGEMIGLTRERMRQIQKKVIDSLPNHEVYMPQLDRALKTLEEAAPMSIEQAAAKLLEEKIVLTSFHPKSLIETAQLLGKTTSLTIKESRTGLMLINDQSSKWVNRAFSLARTLAGKSGISSVFQIQDSLVNEGFVIDENELRRALHSDSVVDFLDENWFWVTDIPIARNRLRNVTRKILSVVSPQTITSIRDGVRRNYKYRSASGGRWELLIVPPKDVMKAFFNRHSEFHVDDDLVASISLLDYSKELGETERILVEVLRSTPTGILDRRGFGEGCITRGMNENTFSVFTSYSSIVEHLGQDLWKLRGVIVDAAEVEAVRTSNNLWRSEKRLQEYGWGENGELWTAVQIPRVGKSSLIIYFPAAIKQYVFNQKFECFDKKTNIPCGTIVVNETGNSYGYGVYINRNGLDENDILLAEFNLATNRVNLSIGDEELIFGD